MLNLETLIFSIPALLFAISVHEFAHGYVAYKLGDPTPKYQGRLSLNPLAHLDPLGALMLLVFRFGWAKPVMVNPLYFKNRRKGMLLVSLAGPVSNVALAWLFYNLSILILPHIPTMALVNAAWMFFRINLQLNLGLAAFNLIPLPPLDGAKILEGVLPPRFAYQFQQLAQYGSLILILFLVTGLAQRVLNPIYGLLLRLITVVSL